MMIGNAKYQCSCVRYVTPQDHTALIAGLTVAIILLLIVIIIVGGLLYRRRRSKVAEEQVPENAKKARKKHDNKENQLYDDYGQQEIEEQYSRKLPDDYNEDNIPMEQQYSSGLPYHYD